MANCLITFVSHALINMIVLDSEEDEDEQMEYLVGNDDMIIAFKSIRTANRFKKLDWEL